MPEDAADHSAEGLHGKYTVLKDGESQDGVFVLRPESDEAALAALHTYAENTDNPALENDLRGWIGEITGRGRGVDHLDDRTVLAYVFDGDSLVTKVYDERVLDAYEDESWTVDLTPRGEEVLQA